MQKIKKFKYFSQPITVFSIFKILHFIMKLFGFFPFKIKHTKTGPKCVICVWGLILTTIHFLTYTSNYILVLIEMQSNKHIVHTSAMQTIVDRFGSTIAFYIEGLSIFTLFASIVITKKAQQNILKLFYQSEYLLFEKSFNFDLLQMFLYSLILLLNFIFGATVTVMVYMVYQAVSPTAIIYLMIRILPHFYILIKTSQFIFYILMLNFGFSSLNSVCG